MQPETADPIVGFWNATDITIDDDATVDISSQFLDDGTGIYMLFHGEKLYREDPIKWKNLGNDSYQVEITNPESNKIYTLTYTLSADKTNMSSDKNGIIWQKKPDLTPLEKNDKIIGTWYATFVNEGQKVNNVFIFHDDGIGYWMKVADSPSISLITMRQQNIRKSGDNTYLAQCSVGRVYEVEYKPETDSFLVDNKSEFKRLDPIVGIWTGNSNKGGDVVTTIIKADGTGVSTTSHADGTAQVDKITSWKKNGNGTYDIVFSNGDTPTYTLASNQKSITSSSGLTKTKQFTESYFLLPMIGAWVSEKGDVAIFNGDKTGTSLIDNQVIQFTWDYTWNETDKIDFMVMYKSGIANDSTNLAGKTFKWTYDLNSNRLINSAGREFKHPEKTVEGKITLN